MISLPKIIVELIAYELENIYDYNALRATNSNVKQIIDQSALKRPFFFCAETKHWVGRYSQRVFLPEDTGVHLLITHPIIATQRKLGYDMIASYSTDDVRFGVSRLFENGRLYLRLRKGNDPDFKITFAGPDYTKLRDDVRGELREIFE